MRRNLVVILIIVLLTGVYPASGNRARAQEIAKNYPFETALELSRILDRQFIFSFVKKGCPHCQEYKGKILSDPDVKGFLNKHFILSLVPVGKTFEIELPERGKVTNIQLASGLGAKGTPTTYVFYPPDPGLLQEGRGITRFEGPPPDPSSMVDLLERLAAESFKKSDKESSTDSSYYNYTPSVKQITKKDFNLLKEVEIGIPIVSEKVALSSLPQAPELIVNISSSDSSKEYSKKIVSETDVKKVFLVES
ncbi:MAG: thioredoxin fold domain-containing protein [Candidatus Bipolaricaulia bacterium]